MAFLDPAFLWGLLAVSIPVALHLLLRRRLPIILFPLTRLVARAEHVQQPRKRLNRVLLLLARMALLLLLALALARLTLGGGEVQASGPVAVAVVLDDSLSMRADSRRGRSCFDEGRDMADALLAALPAGSEAVVIPLSRAGAPRELRLVSPEAARRDLERAEAGWLALQAQPGIDAALGLLHESPLTDRRLVLVSDLARHGLGDLAPARRSEASRPQLVLLVPERADGANLSVAGLEARVLPGGSLRATVRVGAWGEAGGRHRADIDLRTGPVGVEGRLAGRGSVEAASGSTGERRFEVAAPPEGLGVTSARIPRDVLAADDERLAVHVVRRDPRLLVIDGDPQNLSFGSETFYLEKALAPGVGLDLQSRMTTVSELRPEDLEGVSAILLANAPDMSASRAQALEDAVRGGAGLIVALGNRVDQRAWNGSLSHLLPATLGLVSSPAAPATIVPGGMLDLPRVHVSRWFRLEPGPDAEVLLRLSDGSPLLVAGRLGDGVVIVLATSIDREWTDLPISPWFLAFLRETAARAMPRVGMAALPAAVAGRPVDISQVLLSGMPSVEGPAGEVPVRDGVFTPLQPGIFVIRDPEVVAAVAVAPDPAESDLSRVAPEEVARRLEGALDVAAIAAGGGAGWSGGFPAWKLLLLGLCGLLAAESWLARRVA